MNFSNWIGKWEMAPLKITPPFLQMEWTPKAADKNAAWALYIELLTRITTQPLPIEHGDEKAALDSRHYNDLNWITVYRPSRTS